MDFLNAMKRARQCIHLGLYEDETSEFSHWHINEAHYLESWGDVKAFEGTVTIQQPLIAPLYEGKTVGEVLAALTDSPDQNGHDIVRNFWGSLDDAAWEKAVHDGIVSNQPAPAAAAPAGDTGTSGLTPVGAGMELTIRPDPYLWDGRFANNGWLQELPRPQSKLTWDNAAYISPTTAKRIGVKNEDVIELEFKGRRAQLPVWILAGQADECVTVHLGYGRKRAGHVAEGAGSDVYPLRASDALWGGAGLNVRKTGETYRLAATDLHHNMEGRAIVRSATLEEFQKDPEFVKREEPHPLHSLYPAYRYDGYKWGMAINQNSCIGCSACVVACQAENNIPVVGKREVARGREMHWLRIDRYHKGDEANPQVFFQPMLCQHCELAPCEPVCPVAATVHSSDGLNQMVYNRCVGTRYCSNNCPYKVRRFNFFLYSDWSTKSLYGLRNPNVTVRSRGVMEKCTYCVQRINQVKIEAEKQNRAIRDLEVVTACQQACPTSAIVFGNMNDPNSLVAKTKAQPTNYAVLGDLNTLPRTTYLAVIRNPNPEIKG
jgi:molybdopterin-containing oxidoreductase family iron-sulfur binding subunit